MIMMVGERGIGKTKNLIEFAVDNNCIILSADQDRLRRKVLNMGYNPFIVKPFTIETIEEIISSGVDIVIDDIDLSLNNLFKNKLKGFTLTT